jgi:hypothetical protein
MHLVVAKPCEEEPCPIFCGISGVLAYAHDDCNFLSLGTRTISATTGTFQGVFGTQPIIGSLKVAQGYSMHLVGANGETYNTTTTSVKVRYPGDRCGGSPPSQGPIVTFRPIGWSFGKNTEGLV